MRLCLSFAACNIGGGCSLSNLREAWPADAKDGWLGSTHIVQEYTE